MKTSHIFKTIAFSLLMLVSFNIQAQDFPDLDVSPMDVASFPSNYKISNKLIKVTYSRPQLKGRPLSKMTPKFEVWRTGANEATQITLYKDAMFGSTKIKAGTYSLFTIPDEKEWTVIINSDTNEWGAYSYDKAKDVARLKVPVKETDKMLEAFTMTFDEAPDGATLYMGWGNIVVAVPFKM